MQHPSLVASDYAAYLNQRATKFSKLLFEYCITFAYVEGGFNNNTYHVCKQGRALNPVRCAVATRGCALNGQIKFHLHNVCNNSDLVTPRLLSIDNDYYPRSFALVRTSLVTRASSALVIPIISSKHLRHIRSRYRRLLPLSVIRGALHGSKSYASRDSVTR